MKKNLLLLTASLLLNFNCTERQFNNPDDPESDAYNAPPIFTTTVADVQDTLNAGVLWRDTLAASDPESGPISYEMITAPSASTSLNGNIVEWLPEAGSVGDYTIALTVTDAQGKKDTLTWELTVITPIINSPALLTATAVSLTAITLTWTDVTEFESGYEISWSGAGITRSDTLEKNTQAYIVQDIFIANRTYTLSLTAFSSAAASEAATLQVNTPQDQSKKDLYISDNKGSLSYFRSGGSSLYDSLFVNVNHKSPLATGDGLYLWSYTTSGMGLDTSATLEGRFTLQSDSSSTLSVLAPPPQSWLGAWAGAIKTTFSVSVEGEFPTDSLPTTLLYGLTIDTSWHKAYGELMEKAPADLNQSGKSLVEAVTGNMGFIWDHANLIPNGYSTHAKHVHNMLNGSDQGLADYASVGTPSNDKNGPVIYLPAIRQRLATMNDNYSAGSGLLARTDTYTASLDNLVVLTGQAMEWAQIIVESSADQTEATSTNGAELLPRLQVMKTANPDDVSPISTTVYGVDTFDTLFSDLGVFALEKAP